MPASVEERERELILALLRYKRSKPDGDLIVRAHKFQRDLEERQGVRGIELADEYDTEDSQ